jgi:hypothetical protein
VIDFHENKLRERIADEKSDGFCECETCRTPDGCCLAKIDPVTEVLRAFLTENNLKPLGV